MNLSNVSTKDLTDELLKREGIKNINVNVDDYYLLAGKHGGTKVTGPAIIIINQD